MKHVYKNNGTIDAFNLKKINISIYKTMIASQINHNKAKQISQDVSQELETWMARKTNVTYLDIRKQVTIRLGKYDKNIAILYDKHKDLW